MSSPRACIRCYGPTPPGAHTSSEHHCRNCALALSLRPPSTGPDRVRSHFVEATSNGPYQLSPTLTLLADPDAVWRPLSAPNPRLRSVDYSPIPSRDLSEWNLSSAIPTPRAPGFEPLIQRRRQPSPSLDIPASGPNPLTHHTPTRILHFAKNTSVAEPMRVRSTSPVTEAILHAAETGRPLPFVYPVIGPDKIPCVDSPNCSFADSDTLTPLSECLEKIGVRKTSSLYRISSKYEFPKSDDDLFRRQSSAFSDQASEVYFGLNGAYERRSREEQAAREKKEGLAICLSAFLMAGVAYLAFGSLKGSPPSVPVVMAQVPVNPPLITTVPPPIEPLQTPPAAEAEQICNASEANVATDAACRSEDPLDGGGGEPAAVEAAESASTGEVERPPASLPRARHPVDKPQYTWTIFGLALAALLAAWFRAMLKTRTSTGVRALRRPSRQP